MTTDTTALPALCKHLVMYVTEACNMRCQYCFVHKTPRAMSIETARKSIDLLYSKAVSGREYNVAISFFGGEPFLEMDLLESVVSMSREHRPNTYKHAMFGATTNGTIATPRVERLVRDAHMWLVISLDGTEESSRPRPFISGRPTYGVVARNLPKLVSWAYDAVVRMTFHPQSLDLVGNLRHALELGAPSIALSPVVEADWHGAEPRVTEAYEALADWYIQEARRGFILPLEVTHGMLRQWHCIQLGGVRQERPCGVGTYLLSVDPDGHLMPCHRFLYRPHDWLGTVDQPELGEKRTPYVHLLSRDVLGCDTCLAQMVCGGGCRAVVVEAGLDLRTGAHPAYCMLTRAHAAAVYRIYRTLMAEDNLAFKKALSHQRPSAHLMQEFLAR